jgi:uncharacterized protein YjiS (DUF1127 family)
MDQHTTNPSNQRYDARAGGDARPHALGAFADWLEARRTERLLTACSDRTLADIGITREDIPLVARGRDPLEAPVASGWFARLRAGFSEALAARRRWHREQAELMAYSDKELAELGIKRRDIGALVRGTADPTPA